MKKTITIVIILFLKGIITFSQISIDKAQIVPLAPNVAELSKYIDIPTIPMNGVVPISFPLFDLTVGKIHIPITLSYHASGIKVAQQATWVGLGWNLMPGGNIARTVRGIEDEKSVNGWFNQNIPVDTISSIRDYNTLKNWSNNIPDAQPDFFNFSLPGKSGKFLFSRDLKNFVAVPYTPVVINRNASLNTYSIIDEDGTKYYFQQKNNFFNDDQRVQSYVQSWSLTKIVSSDNVDSLDLSYTAEIEFSITSTSSRRYRKGESEDDFNGYAADNPQTITSTSLIGNPILKEITYRDGKVTFYANTVRQDGFELSSYPKHALDSIVVYKKVNNNYVRVKKIGFAYDYFNVENNMSVAASRLRLLSYSIDDITGASAPQTHYFSYNELPIPSTTSFNMDYWGYYNGAGNGNVSLLPNILPVQTELQKFGNIGLANRTPSDTYIMAGMLTKITYPTGGYTSFEYEPNKYYSTRTEYIDTSLASFTLAGTGRTSFATRQADFKSPSADGRAYSSGKINITFSPFSPNAFDVAQTVILKDLTTGKNLVIWYSSDFGNEYTKSHSIEYAYDFDTAHTYQIYAVINDYSTTTIKVEVAGLKRNTSRLIKSGGGIRAKTIAYYNADNTLQKKTRFSYGINESSYGNILMSDDIFYENYYRKTLRKVVDFGMAGCGEIDGSELVYLAQASYPTVTFSSGDVLYPSVSQYEVDNQGIPNGKTVFNYIIPNDYRFVPNPVAVGGKEYVGNSLYEDFLASKSIYKYNVSSNNYSLIDSMSNEYNIFNFNTIKSVSVYNTVDYADEMRCRAGDPPLNDIGYAFYDIKLGKYLLTKATVNQYDDLGNELQSVTDYGYNDKLMLKSTSTTDSKGLNISTSSLYPGDHASTDVNAAVLNQMLSSNVISQPYWKADYKNNTLLRSLNTTFKSGWNGNASQILPSSNILKTRMNGTDNITTVMYYNSYDAYGNISEQQKSNDVKEVYLWGYNGKYPVAKILRSDYSTVITKVTQSILDNINGTTTDATMRAELNKLRTGLPGAHVWTYTYAPLIGMTSETDPAGHTTYYEYDGFGRLQYVKDKDGNIIKMYDYHYKTN
ncbi:hypothetical protein ACDQ55_18515 [Chitinophaga sp. 30R24]|uniref:hypothetical protein n=1 Tax=Chitinophaga sp. 30R24 TaxID=3248838 RepID=UPI003B912464